MNGCPAPSPIELEAIIESMRPRWYIVDQTLPSFGIWLRLPDTSGVCVFQGLGLIHESDSAIQGMLLRGQLVTITSARGVCF